MPEGDAVLRTARRLHDGLADDVVVASEVRWGGRRSPDLAGRRTVEVVSRGKHLLHRLEGGVTIHSHLRMEGRWDVRPVPTMTERIQRSPDLRALLATERVVALGWRLGMLQVLASSEESQVVGHLGPDLLGADWDEQEALRRLRTQPAREVGVALLDQRNLAGLGTIFTAEPLFLQHRSPWSRIDDLTDEQLTDVVRRAQRLIAASARTGRISTTGDPREPTYVHGRSGRPCRRCGGQVRVAPIGVAPQQRTMFYCPRCQDGLAPGDDGRAVRPLGAR